MTTLKAALSVALQHWEGRPGVATMRAGCKACLEVLGEATEAKSLGSADAVELLAKLRQTRSPKSVSVYYGAFRRALRLAGVQTDTWPNAPTPPRKTRDPLKADDAERLRVWLAGQGWADTADLLLFMRGTGLRVNVEARCEGALRLEEGADFDILHIVGKGANERVIPVVRTDTRALLRDGGRMFAMRSRPYRTHLQRWSMGVSALGIKSRLATPHAVRHGYATEVYERSGGNLAMVQELLGHASPITTSSYVSVDLKAKAGVLSA